MTKYNDELTAKIQKLLDGLNEAERARYAEYGYTHNPDLWHVGDRSGYKFAHINCGGSGAFLLDVKTLELYNIMGYGKADYNKKKKADIGNLATVDPKVLHTKRWNYLR